MARTLYDRLNEIKTKHLSPQSATGEKIANDAIEEKHIKDGVVTRRKIADGVVGTDELVDGSVSAVKIASKAVTNDKLQSASVTNEKIADGSITSGKIVAGAITTEKIANGAITREKVADQSVRTEDLVDGAVTNAKLANNAVTASKIAANAIGSSEIQSGAVGSSELAVGSVSTEKIQNGAVTQEKLAAGIGGGDRFTFGTLLTGLGSADVLYLTGISADIPYTAFDLSPWIPAQAKAVILQLGMFNQAFATGRAFFRVRTNTDQRDALGLGLIPGANSQVANQGIVPLVVGTGPRTIEYALESVGGPWSATLTLYITVVGYIM
ncbi:MAG: hypothetical protein AB1599_00285 [Planctomycetota bacterium]